MAQSVPLRATAQAAGLSVFNRKSPSGKDSCTSLLHVHERHREFRTCSSLVGSTYGNVGGLAVPARVHHEHLRRHARRARLPAGVRLPRVEERLRERFHYLEPIDLRLGVDTARGPDEAARELLILKVCLGEIERSRPFLIGLIGDRYGWVPPADRITAAAREAGFERELVGRSVTALEIEYAVLGHDSRIPRSRFYFRDPLPYDAMPPEAAADFSDAYNDQAGAGRVARLKTFLKDTLPRERVRSYSAQWDSTARRVVGLEAWGRQVVEDLWADLEAETRAFMTVQAATWQEHDARLLKQFVATVCREFRGREEFVRQLVDLAEAFGAKAARGACIVGPPGSGKSAIFAELFRRLQQPGDHILLAHAAGIGPRAGEV
jgi:hypothetical protein